MPARFRRTSITDNPLAAPQRPRLSFGMQVALGMAAGVALGLWARALGPLASGAPNGLVVALEMIGTLFVQGLKLLVPPLVFSAIVASVAGLRDLHNAARLAGQTLLWFALTALIAVAIGLALGLWLEPGMGSGVQPGAAQMPTTVGSWLDFVRGLVPVNFLALSASAAQGEGGAINVSLSFNILQIVVLAIAVGAAALRAGAAGEPFLAFNRSLLAISRRLLSWLLKLTPLGTLGLIGKALALYGWQALSQLGTFATAIYVGLGIVLLLVYPALLLAHGLRPLAFFRTAWPAIQLGFVSRSSIGTLPVTESVAERLGVPRAYAAFAVPLAATTKMDGCAAIYPAVASLFVAQFYGIALHMSDYALIALVSVIGSAATAGFTGALVMLTLALSTLGLPLEGAGLLLAIDPILDMGRTAVNVAGQALVPALVARREGILDIARYEGGGEED